MNSQDSCAADTVLDDTYRALIDALGADRLTPTDRAGLITRGLTDDQIGTLQYISMPADGRAAALLVERITSLLGHAPSVSVPGFFTHVGDTTVHLHAYGGLGVPVRNADGLIVGLRIRVVSANGEKQYLWLSRPDRPGVEGAKCQARVHIPIHAGTRGEAHVRISEGEIKSDIATIRTGVLTISLPGVTSTALAAPILRELGARSAAIAVDSDARTNRHVGHALQRLAIAVGATGIPVVIETWPVKYKGVDDALTADDGGPPVIKTHTGGEMWRALADIVETCGAKLDPVVDAHLALSNVDGLLGDDPVATAFSPRVLDVASTLKTAWPAAFEKLRAALKERGIRLAEWEKAVARHKATMIGVTERAGESRKPRIVIGVDEHRVNDEAVQALASHSDLYVRGGALVHVVRDAGPLAGITRAPGVPVLAPVRTQLLREYMSETAHWVEEKFQDDRIVQVPAHPPVWSVDAVHARGTWSDIRPLEAIVEVPVMRPDGTITLTNGYDQQTGLLVASTCGTIEVPESPSRQDAVEAVSVLRDVFIDFPFATLAHLSALLALLLTYFARFTFRGPAPFFLIDASTPGSGKTLAAEVVAEITTGRSLARMSPTSVEEEDRKRIFSLLRSGATIVLLDNIVDNFGNAAWDSLLTSEEVLDRVLGESEMARIPATAIWIGTGNNVVPLGDVFRRILHVRLEPVEANPDARSGFAHDPLLPWVRENRARIVAAVLTLLRAYFVAGRPTRGLPNWGSYEAWSAAVREPLVWAGLPDPYDTRREFVADADATATALVDLVAGFREVVEAHGGKCTAAQAVALIERHDGGEKFAKFRSAVGELVRVRTGELPTPRQLGMLFNRFRGRVVGTDAIDRAGTRGEGGNTWTVRAATDPRGGAPAAATTATAATSLLLHASQERTLRDTCVSGNAGAPEAAAEVAQVADVAAVAAVEGGGPVEEFRP